MIGKPIAQYAANIRKLRRLIGQFFPVVFRLAAFFPRFFGESRKFSARRLNSVAWGLPSTAGVPTLDYSMWHYRYPWSLNCASTGARSSENIVDDDDDDASGAQGTRVTWSIPSTSQVRCDVHLTPMRDLSRSAGDVITDHAGSRPAGDVRHVVDNNAGRRGTHGAVEQSLRLSGCGAERSIKAKRRVIKVTAQNSSHLRY